MILFGGKDVENRSWRTAWQGPLLIHAASGMTMQEYHAAAAFAATRGVTVPPANQLPRGGIVGRVTLVECNQGHYGHRSRWFEGPWGWVLADPQPLRFQPCAGSLRLFVPTIQVDMTPRDAAQEK